MVAVSVAHCAGCRCDREDAERGNGSDVAAAKESKRVEFPSDVIAWQREQEHQERYRRYVRLMRYLAEQKPGTAGQDTAM